MRNITSVCTIMLAIILMINPEIAWAKNISANICNGRASNLIDTTKMPKTMAAELEYLKYIAPRLNISMEFKNTKEIKSLLEKIYSNYIEEIPSLAPNVENLSAVIRELNKASTSIAMCLTEIDGNDNRKPEIKKVLEDFVTTHAAKINEIAASFNNETNTPIDSIYKVVLLEGILKNAAFQNWFLDNNDEKKKVLELHIEIVRAQIEGDFAFARENGYIPENSKCFISDSEPKPLNNLSMIDLYPIQALMKEVEGYIEITSNIDEFGKVEEVTYEFVSDPRLKSEKLILAAKNRAYLPQYINCKPVKGSHTWVAKFSLH